MSAAKLIAVLAVNLVLLPGLAWAATADSRRLDGRLPDNSPVVSIDQPRGTVLDALTAITKQTGWSLVVTAPESVTTPVKVWRWSTTCPNAALRPGPSMTRSLSSTPAVRSGGR